MLQPHPDTPCPVVENIETSLSWTPDGVLKATYTLTGDIDQLRILAHRLDHEPNDLWRHTCFELFVGAQNDAEYYEFNFSPSGEWAAYGFRDYRDGGPLNSPVAPEIVVERDARMLKLTAAVRLDRLPGIQSDLSLWVGLSAVVEDLNERLSYWALKHPPGKPDFHHSDNFALQIEPTVVDGGTIDYTGSR
jgi:hypothetical protein